MTFRHFDEAKLLAEDIIRRWVERETDIKKAMLLSDLTGTFRVIFWSESNLERSELQGALKEACGAWWTGETVNVEKEDASTRELFDDAWAEARESLDEPRFAVLDRHRNRTGWFIDEEQPLWSVEQQPSIVVFYSFKGGFGRSTTLASFAIQMAKSGQRVCVLDCDFDSPGIGSLLAADREGLTANWGVVDFLLESAIEPPPLSDYYHRCDRVSGAGEIVVFPAGRVDGAYPDKLARIDFEEPQSTYSIGSLLARIRDELRPQWILLDARTGISASAGRLLSGIAHLHVLLGTVQEQSWQGLNRVLDRFGRDRLLRGRPQQEVVLIQAMVPTGEAGRSAREVFLSRSEQEFTDRYYSEQVDEATGNTFWDTGDIDSQDAPHRPVALDYDPRLAGFADIADVADALSVGPYAAVAERITSRFTSEPDE